MSFFEQLRRRRMCRSYLPRPIPETELQTVLDAARRTPSAGHAQGVRFAVVRTQTNRKRIAFLAGEEDYVRRGFPAWLSSAPVHLIVGVSEDAYQDRYSESDKSGAPEEWPVPYQILDAGKSLMTLYLAAEEMGLSCGYLGPHALTGLESLLNWPQDWRFVGLVTIGYADPAGRRPSRSHRRGWRAYEEVVWEWDSHVSDEPKP